MPIRMCLYAYVPFRLCACVPNWHVHKSIAGLLKFQHAIWQGLSQKGDFFNERRSVNVGLDWAQQAGSRNGRSSSGSSCVSAKGRDTRPYALLGSGFNFNILFNF